MSLLCVFAVQTYERVSMSISSSILPMYIRSTTTILRIVEKLLHINKNNNNANTQAQLYLSLLHHQDKYFRLYVCVCFAMMQSAWSSDGVVALFERSCRFKSKLSLYSLPTYNQDQDSDDKCPSGFQDEIKGKRTFGQEKH